jgi:hypothetical protein
MSSLSDDDADLAEYIGVAKTAVDHMHDRIRELSDKQGLIIDEADLEFILGLMVLLAMEEPVGANNIPRVNRIYMQALRNTYA